MHFTCAFCGTRVPVNPMFDTSTCPGCRQELGNGLEKVYRKSLEKRQYWMKRPKSVMARAASYANRIYKSAAESEPMRLAEVETRIRKRFGARAAGNSAQCVYTAGRNILDMTDKAIGAMVIEVDGYHAGAAWRYVYVVFRGSAGGDSTNMSGWDTDQGHNLDWRSNLENEQMKTPWGPPDSKSHQGMTHLYMSMRDGIRAQVGKSIRERPTGSMCVVVVCGHSLGAALSQICAHDFAVTKMTGGVATLACFPFCPPRVGNLGFVRFFNAALCDKEIFFPTEGKNYPAAISSVQGIDPVSALQTRSAALPLTPKDGRDVADSKKLLKQGIYAADIFGLHHEDLSDLIAAEEKILYGQTERHRFNVFGRTKDWLKRRERHAQSQAIYYHIKNLWTISLTGFHMPYDNFFGTEGNAYTAIH
ncbi:MAG: hypothetical protein AAFX00_03895 [Pseudomonadota bacterium]